MSENPIVELTEDERDLLADVWDEDTTVSASAFYPVVARMIAARLAPVRAVLSDPANSWWHTGGTPCVPRRALTAVLPPERLAGS